jgi:hypothetical protein
LDAEEKRMGSLLKAAKAPDFLSRLRGFHRCAWTESAG